MEIRQLRYFVEICKRRSFSQAAEICYISSQGISMSMMRLENELGHTLFNRTSKGVTLTAQAEFLLPRAKKILAIVDECDSHFNSGAECEHILPVAFALGTIEEFAGQVISDFKNRYSNIQLDVREYFDIACDEAVENQEVELGLTVGPLPENMFDSELLFSSRHALIVHKDHPLANKKSISVYDLKGVPITVLRGETRTYPCLKQACNQAGFEPNVYLFADNILLVFYMAEVKQACGISTLPLFHRLSRPDLRAIPFEDPIFDWNIFLITKKGASLSQPAKLFYRELIRRRDSLQPQNELISGEGSPEAEA